MNAAKNAIVAAIQNRLPMYSSRILGPYRTPANASHAALRRPLNLRGMLTIPPAPSSCGQLRPASTKVENKLKQKLQ